MSTPTGTDWQAIRHAYCHGDMTVAAIAQHHGLDPSTISRRARRDGWPMRRETRHAAGRAARDSLAERLYRQVEAHVARLAKALPADDGAPVSAALEREARALAALVRVLEKLAGIDAGRRKEMQDAAADGNGQDADELRGRLARRLEQLRRTDPDALPGKP